MSARVLYAEQPGPETAGAALVLAGLGKAFGDRTVLRGIDLSVAPGSFVAVVGRSGCGKSTLLRLAAGLETPSAGRILLDGRPLDGLSDAVRIMFQDARLLPWKRVIDNVGIGLRGAWKGNAHAALRAVGLEDRAQDWPAILSGGQRQRVSLARALVAEPRLLLMDEPLGALDALTRLDMQSLIERVWRKQGCTAILVTHDVAEAVALADRVLVIDGGRIVFDRAIDLPRPRRRADPAFSALEDALLANVMSA